ncbi:MAG TPA: NAD-dependent epimerase/dehydratase family protein [Chthoniobacterales bacterium]|nr:NAD-dependent epimerase/dehydratase family protein [Chthoniobacterales bacterium]
MPRILIAGCGYLGQAAADLFHNAGWEVEGWTMSAESAKKLSGKSYPVIAVDISTAGKVSARAGDFDAVIHCASTRGGDVDLYRQVYLNGARNLLGWFPESVMLFTSSTSVYAQTDGEWATEESAAEPKHETGKILREAEQLVINQGGMAVRLAGIYGPGRSYLLKRFLSGEAIIDSRQDRFVNQIHRDDAAAALFFLLDRQPRNNRASRSRSESPAGEIYNVVDDQPILQSECYRWLAAKLNRRVPPIGKSTSNRKRGRSNKRVSNAKLRGLGWTPRYPTFAEGMENSVLPNL